MKTRKLLAVLTIIAVVIAMMPAMAFAEEADVAPIASAPEKSNVIVILATSDVHCALDTNIGYAGLAAYRKQMEEQYNYVALVDAGDAIQGGVEGHLQKVITLGTL